MIRRPAPRVSSFPAHGRPLSRTRRLLVEPLETRQLLATLVGLTVSNQLITFDSATPETIVTQNRVTGMLPGELLVGIDHRPATGELYGVGSRGRLYTLNANTGAATFKTTLRADPTDTTSPYTGLRGALHAVDFNPTVDRLRVVSDADQNLRINVDTGLTITDTNLAYSATSADRRVNPFVVGNAYTNPDNDPATGTLLYGLDLLRGTLVTQNPANDGTLQTVGRLGFFTSVFAGFDISADGTAYATLFSPSVERGFGSGLYTLDLTTGAATFVDSIGSFQLLRGLSVALPVQQVFAVTSGNNLISFNSARPDVLLSKKAITGLGAGETLNGIDFRPATGVLYGLGSSGRVYTLNTTTAVATAAPALSADAADTTDGNAAFTAISGAAFGFDFNPVPDRLRIVSNVDQNLRANVGTGGTFTDGTLAFATSDINAAQNPNIVASAYTNSFPGATTTLLNGIDSNLDILVTQNPANAGTLQTVGPLGVNASSFTSFDIASTGATLAAITLEGETVTRLYSIGATGAATPIGLTAGNGLIAGGETIRGIAIAPAVVQFSQATYSINERSGEAIVTVVRKGDTTSPVSVNYSTSTTTASGSTQPATEGVDYLATAGLLNFAAGETTKTFRVSIVRDNEFLEAEEAIDLALTTPTGGGQATLGTMVSSKILIRRFS
ncbi:DUF4394 domain-containing protein [Anatilimnocola sp. NA78]|uniref:DUF4394 domain-containing protein n=1 Tax=Anatilimnocola sp. NA78 TaxID=3415683 RepID=UPI003CE5AC85